MTRCDLCHASAVAVELQAPCECRFSTVRAAGAAYRLAMTAYTLFSETHLTCTESDAVVDLYRAIGETGLAAELERIHASYDEPGDAHYTLEDET